MSNRMSVILFLAGLLALAGAVFLPASSDHPVTPAMVAAAGAKSGSRVPETALEGSDGRVSSIAEIAGEKAGIIKPGVPVVLACEQPEDARRIIRERAAQLASPLVETASAYRVDHVRMEAGCVRAKVTEAATGWSTEIAPQLPGRFQLQNALNALAAARPSPSPRIAPLFVS